MACTRPVAVKRAKDSLSPFRTDLVPCGNCIGCDLERSRQWAVRCMHESQLWVDNAFVTLTVDDAHMSPLGHSWEGRDGWGNHCVWPGGSLSRTAMPLFMKRLRREVGRVRVFYCGEYGAGLGRPHYHACLFGWFPPDAVRSGDRGGYAVYRSQVLSRLWPYGFHEVGSVTFDSAAYVARYVTKKVRGDAAAEHYVRVDRESGEVFPLVPEFARMSRRPGIGAGWFDGFGGELEPDGTVIESGKEVPMPRYYRKLMDKSSPEAARRLARQAVVRQFVNLPRMTDAQLQRNEAQQEARLNLGGRRLE